MAILTGVNGIVMLSFINVHIFDCTSKSHLCTKITDFGFIFQIPLRKAFDE